MPFDIFEMCAAYIHVKVMYYYKMCVYFPLYKNLIYENGFCITFRMM